MKQTITILSLLLCMTFSNTANAQSDYLGDIKLTAVNFEQREWMECDGRLLPIASYQALFSLLGTQYGGDGRTTFALPDLRGRVPVGYGNGPGLTNRQQGQKSGTEANTLNTTQLPSHNHTINVVSTDGNQSSPNGNILAGTKLLDPEYSNASADGTLRSNAVSNTGGNQSVNNMQPYVVLRYVICVQGIFPSRN